MINSKHNCHLTGNDHLIKPIMDEKKSLITSMLFSKVNCGVYILTEGVSW